MKASLAARCLGLDIHEPNEIEPTWLAQVLEHGNCARIFDERDLVPLDGITEPADN